MRTTSKMHMNGVKKALLASIDPVDSERLQGRIDIRVQLMLQHIIQELDSNKSMNSSYQVRTRRVKIQFGRKEHGNMRFPKVLEKRK